MARQGKHRGQHRTAHHSLFAVVAHPKATPVAIARSSSISPTIVAARPSMRIRFTPSARSRNPALHASKAFCAFDKSIPDIKNYLGLEEPRDLVPCSASRSETPPPVVVAYLTGAGPPYSVMTFLMV